MPDRAAEPVEVIVELEPPPAARAGYGRRGGQDRARAALQAVERARREVSGRILARIPGAEIRWRYRIVLAGFAVVVPEHELGRLARTPGVRRVYPSVRYHALLDQSPAQIGAPTLWGPELDNAGSGVRIGIIDDGIDVNHPFLEPAGLSMPGGFPKGNAAYTSAKVIVARAFPPPEPGWRNASRPFDPVYSFHGTHVAGIAAGRHGTVVPATADRPAMRGLSGVAPLAYLGNYKVLTVPTAGVGLNGNSPELVAAIEAAVADGMDVINLSLGEPEVEPSRDAVARALDNAAATGVVPVVAAGNDFDLLGAGSVASPGSAAAAITVAAVTGGRYFGVAGRVVGPAPVPPEVETFGGIAAPGGIPPSFASADRRLIDASSVDPAGLLCAPVGDAVEQRIVLVREGGCEPGVKAKRAAAAGALGLVLAAASPGDPAFVPVSELPLLAVSAATGARLAAFVETSGGEILVRIGNRIAEVPSEEAGEIAGFSGGGPTPLSLAFKPDVAAPGVDIVSAQPDGQFEPLSGTSMAAPHVSGAAALLRERHPDWTVEQVKSALVQTADPAWTDAPAQIQAPSTRQGGGIVDLPEAAEPLLFAAPQTLGFGLLDVRGGPRAESRAVVLTDAGGGAGPWRVRIEAQTPWAGARIEAPEQVEVPGSFTVTATAAPDASEGERTGFVVLERGDERRRIPFWFRVTKPRLPSVPARVLPGPGSYAGDTAGRAAKVTRYGYPDRPVVLGTMLLRGPEQAFRLLLRRPAVNLGVAVIGAAPGVRIQPRIVLGTDENRLAGAAALPYVGNPYLPTFLFRSRTAAVLLPRAGLYTLVFDSPRVRDAGRFSFRVWVNDTTPPTVQLESRLAKAGRLFARVSDAGAGVDPAAIFYRIDDGPLLDGRLVRGDRAVLEVFHIPSGRHRLELHVSDRQEAKNNENLTRVLPNTRIVRATIRVL